MTTTDKPRDAGGVAALRCPFCGSDNVSDGESLIFSESHGAVKQSECMNCGACGPLSEPVSGPDYGDVAAITAWNRRAPSALLAECAALVERWRGEPGACLCSFDEGAAAVADELAAIVARHGETK